MAPLCSKAVAVAARGESVGKMRVGFSGAIPPNCPQDRKCVLVDPESQPPFGTGALRQGIARIADQIDQNLEDLVLVQESLGNRFKLADHFHAALRQRVGMNPQCIVHKLGNGEEFQHTRDPGVILLAGHDFLDVFDIARQFLEFLDDDIPFGRLMLGECLQIGDQPLAPIFLEEEGGEFLAVFLQQLCAASPRPWTKSGGGPQ